MITQLSALLHRAATSVEPEKLLLTSKPPSWVHFSQSWPDTHKWARGKYFKVIRTQLVNYPASYILPGDDYADVDLSNSSAGLKLYPTSEGVLYEIALGMKPGDYLLHIFIPKDRYIHALADPSMTPDITNPDLKYLGAKTWKDSPYTGPLLKLYCIKDMPAFILRHYVLEGVDFEECTIEYNVNKCQLEVIEDPSQQQVEQAMEIPWHEDMRGF